MAKKKKTADIIAPTKIRQVEHLTDPNVPTFYANNAQIDISNFDIKIRLGEIMGVTEEKVSVRTVANVYMSHVHFRAFVQACAGLLPVLEKMPDPSAAFTINPQIAAKKD